MGGWSEGDSQAFLDNGRYHVPERETQFSLIRDLLPAGAETTRILEIGCGDGLLASLLLEHDPRARLVGLDGSALMLARAAARLSAHRDRVQLGQFALEEGAWRFPPAGYEAIVSSLALHHLHHKAQWRLYRDLFQMLTPGGALIIADLVEPAGTRARRVAASAWDEAVRQQSQALDGHEEALNAFKQGQYNVFHYPDPMDRPAPIAAHLQRLGEAGYSDVDVYWLRAGHAVFGGRK